MADQVLRTLDIVFSWTDHDPLTVEIARIKHAITGMNCASALAYLQITLRLYEDRPLQGFDELTTKKFIETRISDLVAWRMTSD